MFRLDHFSWKCFLIFQFTHIQSLRIICKIHVTWPFSMNIMLYMMIFHMLLHSILFLFSLISILKFFENVWADTFNYSSVSAFYFILLLLLCKHTVRVWYKTSWLLWLFLFIYQNIYNNCCLLLHKSFYFVSKFTIWMDMKFTVHLNFCIWCFVSKIIVRFF